MTATDKLRELLDERGIEYEQSYIEGIASYTHVTKWETQAGNKRAFYEIEDGYPPYFTWMLIEMPTAAQAIAATVGREMCHIVKTWSDSDYDEDWRYRCSECGCPIPVDERDPETGDVFSAANYCPNCGRRVVE